MLASQLLWIVLALLVCQGDSTVTICGPGTVHAGSCNFDSSSCERCDQCPAGKYQPFVEDVGYCLFDLSACEYCRSCPSCTTSGTGASYCYASPCSSTCQSGACSASNTQCSAGTCQCRLAYKNYGAGCVQEICVAGQYWTSTGCTSCPGGSSSPAGSTSVNQCVCTGQLGRDYNSPNTSACYQCASDMTLIYAPNRCQSCPRYQVASSIYNIIGTGGGQCNICPTGKYYLLGGCTSCPADSSSPENSTSVDQCACAAGKYMSGSGTRACMDCAIGKASPPGSSSVEACAPFTCKAGTFRSDHGCEACPENSNSTFNSSKCLCEDNKEFVGGNPIICKYCQVDQTFVSEIRSCIRCRNGKYATTIYGGMRSYGGGPCTFCELGKYLPIGDNMCQNCVQGRVSPLGGYEGYHCINPCNAGYTGQISNDVSYCVACGRGKYKNTTGVQSCTRCPDLLWTESSGNTNPSACTVPFECMDGKYRMDGSMYGCVDCPAGKWLIGKRGYGEDCVCNAGYTVNPRNEDECTACEAGKYKSILGTGPCTACEYGFVPDYTLGGSSGFTCVFACSSSQEVWENGACRQCPPLMIRTADTANGICGCKRGYFHLNGGCSVCPANTYQDVIGSINCKSCDDGEVSGIGSPGPDNCTFACNAFPGSYWDGSNCVPCPANSKLQGYASNGLQSCLCNAGYTWSYGTCQACPQNTYKEISGFQACSSCPLNTFSGIASTQFGNCVARCFGEVNKYWGGDSCVLCPQNSYLNGSVLSGISSCACNAGYAGYNIGKGSCTACPILTFKSGSGNGNCTACSASSYSNQAGTACLSLACTLNSYWSGANPTAWSGDCSLCPANTFLKLDANLGIRACECNAGYSRETADVTATGCSVCTLNTVPNDNHVGCKFCASLEVTYNNVCVCKSGYGRNSGVCKICSAGTYRVVGGGGDECMPCAGGTYSQNTGSSACSACPMNMYSNADKTACQACPDKSVSPEGSATINACTCIGGYERLDGIVCSQCQRGTFSQDQKCKSCGVGMTSVAGTANPNDCTECVVGKYRDELSVDCISCGNFTTTPVAGASDKSMCICTERAERNADTCALCPAGKRYVGNQYDQTNKCETCNAGYRSEQADASECTVCPQNTFSNAERSGCIACPVNSTSLPGSSDVNACVCKLGNERVNDKCHWCSVGKYYSIQSKTCIQCSSGMSSIGGISTSCKACAAGTYSDAAQSKCLACPLHSSSPDNSPSVFSCKCNGGYTGQNGGQCIACEAGKYESLQVCVDCPDDATSLVGSSGASSCACADTHCLFAGACIQIPENNKKSSNCAGAQFCCEQCPSNTVSTIVPSERCISVCLKDSYLNNEQCTLCPTNSFTEFTGSVYLTDCKCQANNYMQGSACVPCPATSTSDAGAVSVGECKCPANSYMGTAGCSSCPPDSTSLSGSQSIGHCKCSANFYLDAQMCTRCPQTSISEVGSMSIESCRCPPGKELVQQICRNCSESTYKSSDDETCQACPENTLTVASGASSVEMCKCKAGFSGPDGGPCSACAKGMFKEVLGSAPCSDCALHSYTMNSGSTRCTQCAEHASTAQRGSSMATDCMCNTGYSGNSAGTNGLCTACAAGKFKGAMGNTDCASCGAGKYSNTTAVTACTKCAPGQYTYTTGNTACGSCPSHSYSQVSGASTVEMCQCNAGFELNAGVCSGCQATAYKSAWGGEMCVSCGQHEVATANRTGCTCAPLYVMRDAACVPSFCTSGYFQTDAANPGTCQKCPAGKYSGYNENTCAACSEGKYSEEGASACTSCPVGKVQPLKQAVGCDACAKGKYMPNTENTVCRTCVAGKYSAEIGASACLGCPVGTFNANSGATVCSACGVGKFTKASEQSYCATCTAGKFAEKEGSTTCSLCAAGKFSYTVATVCQTCPAGKFSTETSSVCRDCADGSVSESEGSTVCTPCAAGEYSESAKSCVKCPRGTAAKTPGLGDWSCELCEPGKYVDYDGASACVLCAPGQYSESALACVNCPKGKASGEPGAEIASCAACMPGGVAESEGMSECSLCAAGQYAESALACVNCPKGTASRAPGAELASCAVCEPGTVADTERTIVCRTCDAGQYASGGLRCELCPSGTASADAGDGETSCLKCDGGKYQAYSGKTACDDCEAGKASPQQGAKSVNTCASCGPGNFSAAGAAVCMVCPEGKYSDKARSQECSACALGKFQDTTGASSASACVSCASEGGGEYYGQAAAQRECTSCANGTLVKAGAENVGCVHNCSAGEFSGHEPGKYGCFKCPIGKYQDESLHSLSACGACGEHKSTAVRGSSSCSCDRGFYPLENSNGACAQCEVPAYKDWVGDDSCLICAGFTDGVKCECEKGFYDAGQGPTLVCTPCPPGSSTIGVGAEGKSACVQCEWDNMMLAVSVDTCKSRNDSGPCVCGAGFIKTETACKACVSCPCGRIVSSPAAGGPSVGVCTWSLLYAHLFIVISLSMLRLS